SNGTHVDSPSCQRPEEAAEEALPLGWHGLGKCLLRGLVELIRRQLPQIFGRSSMERLGVKLAILRSRGSEPIEVLRGLLIIQCAASSKVFDKVIDSVWHVIPFLSEC